MVEREQALTGHTELRIWMCIFLANKCGIFVTWLSQNGKELIERETERVKMKLSRIKLEMSDSKQCKMIVKTEKEKLFWSN